VSSPTHSVSFDRAAEYYDETRALPDKVARQVLDNLVAELKDRGPVLEVGIGTGRWAIPLAAGGIAMHGIDISLPMLHRLREKTVPGVSVGAARADATSLPFANGGFGAVVASHVLHLIPDWDAAVREMLRVVQPGGVVLVDAGGSEQLNALLSPILETELGRPLLHPGLNQVQDLDQLMTSLGATCRFLEAVTERMERPLRRLVNNIRSNQWSFTWSLDEAGRERAAQLVERWAAGTLGSVDEPREYENQIIWRAYDTLRD